MATPIKETPILEGKDAVEFEKSMREAEERKVPAEDFERGKEIYERVVKNSPNFV
jgi:hypothetical protein